MLNDLYAAAFLRLFRLWKGQHGTIADAGFFLKGLSARVFLPLTFLGETTTSEHPPLCSQHIPAQCQGLPCPRSLNIHSLILTLRFFHNFSLSQCVKGCFSSHFAPQRDAVMGWVTRGDIPCSPGSHGTTA